MDELIEILGTYKIIVKSFVDFWWILLPPVFYFAFKMLWMDFVIEYSKYSWLKSLRWTMLEVIPPKNLEKGPKPMEAIFQGICGVVESGTAFKDYIIGRVTDRFSFEFVSEGGELHFYIRVQKKFKNMVEAAVYAQYPDAQVIEVEDYTKKFPVVVPNKYWDVWGSDMEFNLPDPYPIRTYDKFEEDITGTMIDPLASFAEFMSNLPSGQNIWIQFILSPLEEAWKVEQMREVEKLAGRKSRKKKGPLGHLLEVFTHLPEGFFKFVEFSQEEIKDQQPLEFRLTPVEKEVLKAVETNLSKNMYSTKMRFIYIGQRDGFDKSNVTSFFGAMRQFNDLHSNGLKPNNLTKTFAYYVSIDKRANYRKRKIYRRYRDRDMDGPKIVMSTSELATVYHFPDMGVKAPTIQRVSSKTSTAPHNLPVQ